MTGPLITDEMKSLVGKWQGEPYVGGEVHLEDIRKFAKAIADNNPLWSDTDYAANTRLRGIIAPPTFVDRFTPFYVLGDDNSQGFLGGPMPVKTPFTKGFSAGDEYELFKAVRPGDVISETTTIGDLFEKQSRSGAGRMLFVRYDKCYRNQRNEVVAICRWTSVSYEGTANGDGQQPVEPGSSTAAGSVATIASSAADEAELWTTQAYDDDVTKGFELTPVTRLQSQKRFVRYAQASNDLSEIHYNYTLVRERGMPDVVGQGALSAAYIGNMITNWCSPDGYLKKLSVQYRHFTVPGDVVTTRGVVRRKRRQNAENLVDLDVWAENQNGRKVTLGKATVGLPSREG